MCMQMKLYVVVSLFAILGTVNSWSPDNNSQHLWQNKTVIGQITQCIISTQWMRTTAAPVENMMTKYYNLLKSGSAMSGRSRYLCNE